MWTPEQVLSFSPDKASKDRARQLAVVDKWNLLGVNGQLVGGIIPGSRSGEYRTCLDLSGPAFKCTCPSKKFPCKHILALFLLYATEPASFRQASTIPEWVLAWQQSRGVLVSQKVDEQQAKKEAQKKKTFDARLELMSKGLKDLEQWLEDNLHQGLASLENLPYHEWEAIAGRMIDHKLKGVSRRLRQMPLLNASGSNWPERMLSEMADLYLMIKGFEKLEELPEDLQKTLLSVVGVNTPKSTVLLEASIPDQWAVVGQYSYVDEDNLNVRRTWVYGQEKEKWGLILDYAFGNTPFEYHYTPGKIIQAKGHFYPGASPIRIILADQSPVLVGQVHLFGYQSISTFLFAYAEALKRNPWLRSFPCCLSEVIPVKEGTSYGLLDTDQKVMKLQITEPSFWKLLAMSGGHPIQVFGEWTGELLLPLSAEVESRFVPLG